MQVFKFGGSSVKDANGIRNICQIINSHSDAPMVLVISAMAKTTNELEQIVNKYFEGEEPSLSSLKTFHQDVLNDLFDENHPIYDEVNNLFVEIEWILEEVPSQSYAYIYDQIVSVGELLSTKIVSAYLNFKGMKNEWVDARDIIRTDNTYRNARVCWDITKQQINRRFHKGNIYLTQGFIGCTSENFTTTLGREGSDFTSAIIAHVVDAEKVVIWKDVKGVLNADPRYFEDAELINELSFQEAIELAYFGAKVIHPKTIQPLKDKKIPLYVKSFIDPDHDGTVIREVDKVVVGPCYIVMKNQMLLHISVKDLSFIVEDHLSQIFSALAKHNVKVNVMQNTAVSFTLCIENDLRKIIPLLEEISESYSISKQEDLTLYTVRNYDQIDIPSFIKGKQVFLQQKSDKTLHLVVN